jgi:hypothetical protein
MGIMIWAIVRKVDGKSNENENPRYDTRGNTITIRQLQNPSG